MSYRGTRLGRRNRDASWQWMIIGIFLGMGCSLVMLLTANVFGFVTFSSTSTDEPDVVVATSTEDPATATSTPEPDTDPAPTTDDAATDPASTSATDGITTFTPDPAAGGVATATITPLPGGGGNGASGGTPVVGTQAVDTQEPVGLPTSAVPEELQVFASPLLPVAGGSFMMGTTLEEGRQAVADCVQRDGGNCTEAMILDSTPPHQVQLDPFQIEQFEVSVGQYAAFLNYLLDTTEESSPHLTACSGGPCVLTTNDSGGENSDILFDGERYEVRGAGTSLDRSNHPITLVTWYGAKRYCQALGRDLPTEAQWERAARGPDNWIYPWGQQWLEDNANTSRSGPDTFVEVTEYAGGQSNYGALNMAGNVAEWTNDWYSENYYRNSETINPLGPASGTVKVVRGGSWDFVPLFARAVHRMDQWEPNEAEFSVGFRCAAEAGVTSQDPVDVGE